MMELVILAIGVLLFICIVLTLLHIYYAIKKLLAGIYFYFRQLFRCDERLIQKRIKSGKYNTVHGVFND